MKNRKRKRRILQESLAITLRKLASALPRSAVCAAIRTKANFVVFQATRKPVISARSAARPIRKTSQSVLTTSKSTTTTWRGIFRRESRREPIGIRSCSLRRRLRGKKFRRRKIVRPEDRMRMSKGFWGSGRPRLSRGSGALAL